ncbi:MAG TPA: hypothetical protein VD902_05240, partial [Symbiobacteriaceae bacterium]|nr:hypothetical protein [Symbiobacteriaceae bacterium]
MRRWGFWPAVLVAVCLVFLPVTALANSAPPQWHGDKGGVLVPGTSGEIHVLGEELRFDVEDSLATAQVSARYEMANRGPAVGEFPVVFVYQGTGSAVKVTWNGQPLEAAPVLLDEQAAAATRAAWTAMDTVVDPVNGEVYSSADFFGHDELGFVQFALTMGAGETGTLEVSYKHTAAEDRTRHAHRLYHYQYLLLPAKGWASFGPLEVRVKAPGAGAAFFASTIPMTWQ